MSLSGADAGADRAGHSGAAETAIAARILGEILLVIVFSEVELRRGQNLGGDRSEALRFQRLIIGALGGFRGAPMMRR